MTQHILTLSNYLTNPLLELVTGIKDFFVKLFVALQESRMRSAMVYVRNEMLKHKHYRDTYNQLSKLSDKELRDIGIGRGEIHSIAMEAYLDNRIG